MTMDEVILSLQRGTTRGVAVIIRPGWRAEQIAEYLATVNLPQFDKDEFLEIVQSGDSDYSFLQDRKSNAAPALPSYLGHVLSDNRHGLVVNVRASRANGTAERTTALDMIEDNVMPGSTVGGDKNYDTADFVAGCRERGCTPHVSQNNTNRRSAIDARTTRHPGYRISTIKRKRIEEPFGWMKTVGGLRKTRHRGRGLVEWFFVLTAAAYNLVRIPKLLPATG
jgi:hypothetical protein